MPRLPPVDISPHTRLRARFWPGVIDSVATFFQSHSSSSATSWAKPVSVPCPISERAMRMTHVSSGLTTTHAWTSVPVSAASLPSTGPTSKGERTTMARPPPAAAVPTMRLRRVRPAALMRVFLSFMSGLLPAGGHVHRGPDALIRAAPADIRHGLVDVPVGRVRLLLQERRCRHDLAGLAVAALWHVERRPGSLHGMRAGGRQAFDGEDLVAGLQPSHGNGARANELAVDVH